MNKLVEDFVTGDSILITDTVLGRLSEEERRSIQGKHLKITEFYPVNGEGVGFVSKDETGAIFYFSKTCGTYLTAI